MDPITHTLTGLALSRAGLNRVSPYATPVLCLAANAPDCDIVTAPWGSVAYLHFHRHITHGLVMIPAMALLAVLVVWPFARKHFDWKLAYAVALVGAATHPLLDWMNAYGIRLLLPFSGKWYALSILSLPDYWRLARAREPAAGGRLRRCASWCFTAPGAPCCTIGPWPNWRRGCTAVWSRCAWRRSPDR